MMRPEDEIRQKLALVLMTIEERYLSMRTMTEQNIILAQMNCNELRELDGERKALEWVLGVERQSGPANTADGG